MSQDLDSTEIEIDQSLLQVGQKDPKPEVKDNRIMAILAINMYAVGTIGQSILFKHAIATGVAVIDYQIFRNLSLLFFSATIAFFSGLKPLKRDFPNDLKHTLFWRMITG